MWIPSAMFSITQHSTLFQESNDVYYILLWVHTFPMKNWLFCFYKTFKDWFHCISFLMNLPQQHIRGPVFSIRPQMEQDINVGRSGPKPQLWKEMSEFLHVTCIIKPVCIQRSWLHKGIGHSCLQGSLRNSLLLQLGQPRADNKYLPCKPLI